MPREFLIEMTAPQELTGVPVGTILRRYSVDCDEYVRKNLGVVIDENPAPKNFLLDEQGNVPIGVMSSSQAKQTPEQRESEQHYLRDQVKNLDAKHEAEQEQKRLKDAVAQKRREVAHE